MIALIIIIVYVVGIFASLILLHITDGLWGLHNDYDPPHDDWYDDYDSNAHAYLVFSLGWPFFYFLHGLYGLYELLLKLSEKLGDRQNGHT